MEFVSINEIIIFKSLTPKVLIEIFFFTLLLISSALISGSEVAFFSLEPKDLDQLKNSESKRAKTILKLLQKPDNLLATILISNNFVNIGIVILSTFISDSLFTFNNETVKFIFEVVIITFLILLFGEVIPKVYANTFNRSFAMMMAYPLWFVQKLLSPFAKLLINSSNLISKFFKPKVKLSIDDIAKAIDITSVEKDERKMLKDIVKFGSVEVKEIMVPRVDVVAMDYDWDFEKVKEVIAEHNYSRYPVYQEVMDNIKGILVIKKLINYLDEKDFRWQDTLISPLFVPESMKIDDLLELFQKNKTHMAIVIDEFGGFSGIVTLEDVLEEVIGEIKDEYDEQELGYKQIDENTFEFDGKFLIKDFYRLFNINTDIFDKFKGEAETLGGLILEIKGDFPKKDEVFKILDFEFKVTDIDKRHIKKVQVKVPSKYKLQKR